MNKKLLINKRDIFWDFDGVIKDSVEIKSNAYEELFTKWGNEVANRVRGHHNLNGGMSRFDKIPLYLSWTNETLSNSLISKLCDEFSNLVKFKVINSPWVPGVHDLLHHIKDLGSSSYVVTATPQDEIIEILQEIDLLNLFKEIIGAPIKKTNAICSIMNKYKILSEDAVMIGDSKTDMVAAKNNNIDFILRKTNENYDLQNNKDIIMIDNFL